MTDMPPVRTKPSRMGIGRNGFYFTKIIACEDRDLSQPNKESCVAKLVASKPRRSQKLLSEGSGDLSYNSHVKFRIILLHVGWAIFFAKSFYYGSNLVMLGERFDLQFRL